MVGYSGHKLGSQTKERKKFSKVEREEIVTASINQTNFKPPVCQLLSLNMISMPRVCRYAGKSCNPSVRIKNTNSRKKKKIFKCHVASLFHVYNSDLITI